MWLFRIPKMGLSPGIAAWLLAGINRDNEDGKLALVSVPALTHVLRCISICHPPNARHRFGAS
jgi:hypothetical protein